MQINMEHKPENKSRFSVGDLLGYKGSPTRFMVVGEDELYVHTFVIGTGQYWGIFKLKEDNLSCVTKFDWSIYKESFDA